MGDRGKGDERGRGGGMLVGNREKGRRGEGGGKKEAASLHFR